MSEQLTLGELIAALENADQDLILPDGFDEPHSYRGVYAELAFEPAGDVTVAAMLASAYDALDNTYEGYKGGHFTMTRDTWCHIAVYGCCGDEDGLTRERLAAMLAAGVHPAVTKTVDGVTALIEATMDEVESIGQSAATGPIELGPRETAERFRSERDAFRDELYETRAEVDQLRAAVTAADRVQGVLNSEIGRLRHQLAMHLTAWRNARRGRAEARGEVKALKETVAAADAERDRLEADRDRIRGERDRRDEQVQRVQAWLTSDVVTARNEFGSGYREALRDVRDILNAPPTPAEPGA